MLGQSLQRFGVAAVGCARSCMRWSVQVCSVLHGSGVRLRGGGCHGADSGSGWLHVRRTAGGRGGGGPAALSHSVAKQLITYTPWTVIAMLSTHHLRAVPCVRVRDDDGQRAAV